MLWVAGTPGGVVAAGSGSGSSRQRLARSNHSPNHSSGVSCWPNSLDIFNPCSMYLLFAATG